MVNTLPSNAGGAGSIPGQGAKIPHALRPKNQNIKQKQYCNKFNKDLKKKKKECLFQRLQGRNIIFMLICFMCFGKYRSLYQKKKKRVVWKVSIFQEPLWQRMVN